MMVRRVLSAALCVTGASLAWAGQARPTSIEGVWGFATLTPLERPASFGDRRDFTDAEAEAFVRDTLSRGNRDRRDGGAQADVGRAVNDYWFERGDELATVDGRKVTSLVVDPSDGRVPARPSGRGRGGRGGRGAVPTTPRRGRCRSAASRSTPARRCCRVPTTDKVSVQGSDEAMRLVERFTLVDERTLHYAFTVNDPTAFSVLWSALVPMTRTDDRLFEYACHEGNYALPNILKGARAAERP